MEHEEMEKFFRKKGFPPLVDDPDDYEDSDGFLPDEPDEPDEWDDPEGVEVWDGPEGVEVWDGTDVVEELSDYGTCECGAFWVIRKGKYGLFYGCSNYPKCEKTKRFNSKSCVCGGQLLIRAGRYGKFYGCSNYPKCKKTKKYPLPTGDNL